MIVHIDKAGRIVVPKRVRDRLGLRADSELEIVEHRDGALLKVRTEKPVFAMVEGVLVHQGETNRTFDFASVVDELRDERLQSVIG